MTKPQLHSSHPQVIKYAIVIDTMFKYIDQKLIERTFDVGTSF
jgi:hypothetical protein